MKIAVITTTFKPELSGIAETVYKRVKSLSQRKDLEILLLVPDYEPVKEYLPNYKEYLGRLFPNVLVKTYPTDKPKTKVDKKDGRIIVPFFRYNLDKDLEAFKPDIIHVDEPERLFGCQIIDGYMRRVGVAYAKKHNIPICAMWHTDYYKYSEHYISFKPLLPMVRAIFRKLICWVYNSYDLTICNSREAEGIMKDFGVLNARFMNSVGIDLEHFKRRDIVRDKDIVNIIYVGRITPEKNTILLLQAFTDLSSKHPNLRLHIVGDGPQYQELFTTYGSNVKITFHGRKANEQLPEYLSLGDIFVNPSHTETFTQTAAEAVACSLPIVVAAGGGNFEMVREGYNGLFFEPNNAQDLAAKLDILVCDKTKREEFAKNSRILSANFDQQAAADNFLDVWTDLIGKRAKPIA